jgi:hypothetical protein
LVHVITREPRREERAIKRLLKAANVGLQGISQIEPSLEDVFIAYMR